jgi:hypothetical protein
VVGVLTGVEPPFPQPVLVGWSGLQRWSMLGIVLAGLVLMVVARFAWARPVVFARLRQVG